MKYFTYSDWRAFLLAKRLENRTGRQSVENQTWKSLPESLSTDTMFAYHTLCTLTTLVVMQVIKKSIFFSLSASVYVGGSAGGESISVEVFLFLLYVN